MKRTRAVLVAPKQFDFVQEEIPKLKENEVLYKTISVGPVSYTHLIEGFNRQLRKVTKAKSVFPTDDSLLKMLYLAMMDITKKWTGRRQDWSPVSYTHLDVYKRQERLRAAC